MCEIISLSKTFTPLLEKGKEIGDNLVLNEALKK
jgi:hypothetical protein